MIVRLSLCAEKKICCSCNDGVDEGEFSRKVCAHLEEERRTGEELRGGLEKEREELRTKLRDATNEVRGQIALAECVFTPYEMIKVFRISAITLVICDVSVLSDL